MHRCSRILRTVLCWKKSGNASSKAGATYVNFEGEGYGVCNSDYDTDVDVFCAQELKDEHRDVDTEEELLLLVLPDDASNGSRSESSSPSDRSSSVDGCVVQIFVGDEPFAGLFKGSVIADSETAAYYAKSEKPATYSPLRNVYGPSYDYVTNGCQDVAKNERSSAATTVAAVSSGGPSAATHQPVVTTSTNGVDEGTSSSTSDQNLFDEQEEWAKISEIMASFGKGNGHQSSVAEVEHQIESRSDRSFENSQPVVNNETSRISFTSVGQWLQSLGFMEFENAFVNFGYDDINFINGVINDCDLKEIGVMRETDRQTILKECATLPNLVGRYWRSLEVTNNPENVNDLVNKWLNSINLGQYVETFRRNLYNDLDRIKRIWEVELTAFLEITKPGHRRRILASVNECKNQPTPQLASSNGFSLPNNLDELHADLDQLKNNIQELEEEIRTKNSMNSLESRCKTLPLINSRPPPVATYQKSATSPAAASVVRPPRKARRAPPPPTPAHDLPIRSPSELLVGVPTLEAQWRHKPSTLVNSTVDYRASYLGSTVVKELQGTESTKKSIQKLRKSTSVVDCRITPEIILAISHRGVKFLNVPDNSLICEHEIRNIHCACQDSEDLTHFAYITKDRASRAHYCHVFCVQTMDEATEVILTLGQAFEVAYQIALKEHSDAKLRAGVVRSHSTGSSTVMSRKTRNGHLGVQPLPPPAPVACGRLSRYFALDSEGRVPLLALLAEARFDEVKRLLEVVGASDVEMLRRLALSVASAEFRNRCRVEKKVADEVFAQAIAELSYRSQNTGQLRKYYRTSYSEGAPTDGGAHLSQYLARAADSRVPLWTMMVERRYDEVGRVLGAAATASELDVLKLVAASVADKAFRETHGVTREVADEVFECAADELMAGEGTVAQLLDLYNKSYN